MFDDDISELMLRIEALESRLDKLETLLQKKLADVPSAPRQSKTREKQPVFEIGIKGKYRFLADYLHEHGGDTITMSFDQIEQLVGDKLPRSAYNYRAYWSNTDTHTISRAWMRAGDMTTYVNLLAKKVTFEKRRSYDSPSK